MVCDRCKILFLLENYQASRCSFWLNETFQWKTSSPFIVNIAQAVRQRISLKRFMTLIFWLVVFILQIWIINIHLLLFSISELQEHLNSDAWGPRSLGLHHGIEKGKQVMCQSLELKIEIEKNNSLAAAKEKNWDQEGEAIFLYCSAKIRNLWSIIWMWP